ncbi:MAG: hypothetical protein E7256_04115 [Lachnospiraceae bacterium]|nr:hypothetical protein [Lachnospiraceae bacterium]
MNEYVERYFGLIVGLFIMSIGVGLSTKANLGTSPVSCVPYVLSLSMPLSMGTITIITHVIFILLRTIDAAILVGLIIGFINRNLSGIYRYMGLDYSLKDNVHENCKDFYIFYLQKASTDLID